MAKVGTIQTEMVANPSRRGLITAGAALGGGLLVGFSFGAPSRAQAPAQAASFKPNAFIRVDRDGVVTLILPRAEMGQGIHTAISVMLAEELAVSLDQVRTEFASPADAGVTGGSNSVRSTFKPLGQAGATARIMLVTAAAQAWGVNADSCTASNCQVIHASTGRKFDYGKLVDAAAKLPVPKDVVLKGHADYVLLGKPRARMDGPSKVDGSAKFGIDARPPGLKFAAIAACPVFGGTLKSADEAAALKVKGMIKVVRLYNAVAVIADHTGAAKKGLAALDPQWDLGPNAAVNQAEIVAAIDAASKTPGVVAPSKTKGDADKAMVGAARKIEAVYEQPFLAHAPMEPINCTARVTEDLCEVWLGHQAPQAAEGAAAKASDLPVEKVVIHNHLIGGGFGRKVELDMVTQAVSIAKTVDYPVSLIWSREEDIQHDFYRPYYIDRLAAGLGADNKPVAWTHRITGSSVLGRFMPPVLASAKGVDFDAIEGAETPYALSNMKVEYVRHESMVPTGFWRGVGTTHNVFVVESFIDECAHAAGADPVAYRRALVTEPRTLAVLEMAAAKADWGKPLPPGWGRGISLQSAWDTHLCQVIDAEVTKTGEVKVHRVVCVVDCGQMINPETVRAQVQGGIIFGLTAALHGEITIANGRVEQANFDTYAPLRMRDAPKIEAYLIENHESPGGMGEPPTAGAAAALANAVFAATGKRVRKLPLSSAKLV